MADHFNMDFSDVLVQIRQPGRSDGQTAADDAHAAPVEGCGPTVPDWAEDDVLDRAFASWTPGPPADAPSAEREMVKLAVEPDGERASTGGTPQAGARWMRSDDDILPPRPASRWARAMGRRRR